MAKTSTALLIIGIIILVGASFLIMNRDSADSEQPQAQPMFADYEKKTITVNNKQVEVWIADTPARQARGLMQVTQLGNNQGMLFVFPDYAVRTFWNMNTLIPLDIVWMKDDVVAGVSALPAIEGESITRVSSPEPVNNVLEVPAGWMAR